MRDLIDRAFIDLANLTVREEDEEGQGMVEYGLIISLVAIVVVAALLLLGPKIALIFSNVTNVLK